MTTETNQQKLYRDIVLALTRDDGGCWKVCEMCHGCRYVESTAEYIGGYPRFESDGCSDCNGTGRVENRERIDRAVLTWCNGHTIDSGAPFIYRRDTWNNRKDQPWQEALEEFVLGKECENCKGAGKVGPYQHQDDCPDCNGTGLIGGYRVAPPDLLANDGRELKRMLRVAEKQYEVGWEINEGFNAWVDTISGYADTEAEALLLATREALGI